MTQFRRSSYLLAATAALLLGTLGCGGGSHATGDPAQAA